MPNSSDDYYQEVTRIEDGMVDMILTCPPYNISRPRIFAFEGRGDLNLDFGKWDKYGEKNFIALFFQAMEQRLLEKTDFYTSVEK